MDINTFAAKYSVKVRREECADSVVVGKHGNVYGGFNCGRLGVCLLASTNGSLPFLVDWMILSD
jgi:hypothetical protein